MLLAMSNAQGKFDFLFGNRKSLPVLHSAEVAECGVVCIAMIAIYYGHDIDVNALRQRIKVSGAGTTLRSLIQIADTLDLSSRAIRVDLEDLVNVQTPAILHWDMNHFVVLKSVRGDKIIIHDPNQGRRAFKHDEISKHYTGVCLELARANRFEKKVDKRPTNISSLWTKIGGFWTSITQVLVLSLALQIVSLAAPFYLQLMVDSAVPSSDKELAVTLALAFIGIMCIRLLTELLRTWVTSALSLLLGFQMVGNIVRHLLRLRVDYFEARHIGDILSRIGSISNIKNAFTTDVISVVLNSLMALLSLAIILVYSVQLSLIVLLSLFIELIISLVTYPYFRRLTEEQIHAKAKEDSFLMESIRASTTIKLMSFESEREAQWRNYFAKEMNIGFSITKLNMFTGLLSGFVSGLESILITYFAIIMIINNTGFSIGMLFAFVSFKGRFRSSASSLIDLFIKFKLLSLHLDRVGDIIHAQPDSFSTRTDDFTGDASISLKNISFRYGTNMPYVFENVSLNIEDGEYIAFIGPSGGGKTTLLKLLIGLYRPEKGSIYLGGQEANQDLFQSWRRVSSAIMQEDKLLTGSIEQNIAFFDPDVDADQVLEAAEMAYVHKDIEAMPMKYQSLVGDMGSTLSGGQKQRILLARAIYRNPRVLYMDEGTANLDPKSETNIANVIKSLPITRVVIAHRPALIEDVDRVYRVADGAITEVKKSEVLT